MLINTLEIAENKDNNPKYTVVDFSGDMDSYGIKDKKKLLEGIVETFDKKYLVFNFTNLNYINSESIGLLFHFHELLEKKEKQLVLIALKKNVEDVLNEIGLLSTIKHFKALTDFLKSIEND